MIDKRYSLLIAQKVAAFRKDMPSKKLLLVTIITTYGVADNEYKLQLIDNEVKMDALFDQI